MIDLKSLLERGTSPVDWCEGNYKHHPLIAEFANTFSNVTFLIASPILIYLFNDYAKQVNRGIYFVWIMFAGIGLASAYFHATLSLLGQLLDELMILWLLFASFGMWIPRRSYPKIFKGDRILFKRIFFALSAFLSVLALFYPWINAFVLVGLSIPTFLLLFSEFKR
jgi:alkaline ceramidase